VRDPEYLPYRQAKAKRKKTRQLRILQSLPGIGPDRAGRLLERFGTVRACFDASKADLLKEPRRGRRRVDARRVCFATSDLNRSAHSQLAQGKAKFLGNILGSSQADPNFATYLLEPSYTRKRRQMEFCGAYPWPNEPIHSPPHYKNALGGNGATGWDWMGVTLYGSSVYALIRLINGLPNIRSKLVF
jgi:hypothetical protein